MRGRKMAGKLQRNRPFLSGPLIRSLKAPHVEMMQGWQSCCAPAWPHARHIPKKVAFKRCPLAQQASMLGQIGPSQHCHTSARSKSSRWVHHPFIFFLSFSSYYVALHDRIMSPFRSFGRAHSSTTLISGRGDPKAASLRLAFASPRRRMVIISSQFQLAATWRPIRGVCFGEQGQCLRLRPELDEMISAISDRD